VNRLLEDLRRLSHDLRPAALDRLGLGPALRELGEGFAAGGLEVDVRVDPEDLGPAPEVAVHLFRVAQAALANVARHARVRRARVALVASGAAIRLEVGDDGAGFDPDSIAADAGLGLLGMRERASWLKGTFSLDSAPGRGTRIAVEVPIPAMGKWT
jgi:two-component system, NarL family, sensor kinase